MSDRLSQLEARFERLLLDAQDIRRKLAQALQQIRDIQAVPAGGGYTPTTVYYIAPVVIAAGGSVTGQTVYQLLGGTPTTVSTSATVYNVMADATSATVTSPIIIIPNGDGTYLAVSQGCT